MKSINEMFLKELSKELKISEKEVADSIENLEIDIFDTPEEAYKSVMSLESMSKDELIDFLIYTIKEKSNQSSVLSGWLNSYDGIFYTDNGIAYINQSFYDK